LIVMGAQLADSSRVCGGNAQPRHVQHIVFLSYLLPKDPPCFHCNDPPATTQIV
jgi:hypothetical protein